ncbi:MAG: hypothetical protein LBU16_01580 [Treponema sp.]|nr:hypothetical protein [Treponema sp.]
MHSGRLFWPDYAAGGRRRYGPGPHQHSPRRRKPALRKPPIPQGQARTLPTEYGVLAYTITIAKAGETTPVFTQQITETSVAATETGICAVSAAAKNSGNVLVAEGSGTVAISLGVESPVTI